MGSWFCSALVRKTAAMSLELNLQNEKKEVRCFCLVFVFVWPMTRKAQTVKVIYLHMAPDPLLFQNEAYEAKVKHCCFAIGNNSDVAFLK